MENKDDLQILNTVLYRYVHVNNDGLENFLSERKDSLFLRNLLRFVIPRTFRAHVVANVVTVAAQRFGAESPCRRCSFAHDVVDVVVDCSFGGFIHMGRRNYVSNRHGFTRWKLVRARSSIVMVAVLRE